MLHTARCRNGAVTAPHRLAAQAGLAVLQEGGSAVEASVAALAVLAVVYPQMNSIGGDGFWLIAEPGADPVAIDACGRAGAKATLALYKSHGLETIPWRGPLAANTVAGTISGWAAALERDKRHGGGTLPLARLLRDAIAHAKDGVPLATSTATTLAAKAAELSPQPGFAKTFLPGGHPLPPGGILRQPYLAWTLETLAEQGLDCFYRGEVAARIAADLAAAGAPLGAEDLYLHKPSMVKPLQLRLRDTTLFNLPPPTQGLASLIILGLFDRLGVSEAEGFAHVHGLVEATKRAFAVRDTHVQDPAALRIDPQLFLDDADWFDRTARAIDRHRALPWPQPPGGGDTVWMGAIDSRGQCVSTIQSTYFELGSGLVLPQTGITWQNRGSSFRLAEEGWNVLKPGAKPFHTLNPAMARFDDGRSMVYGTMGGEGQPQTQAAIFTRYARFGQELQQAVTAPRWLLGRTWGEASTSLKLEGRFDAGLQAQLTAAGHAVEVLPDFSETMGHAGALVRHGDGSIEGASDPRSDGAVACY